MAKKRILLAYLAYPFTIASYFRHALEKRTDVDLFTMGAYTGDRIPWGNGMRIPARYVKGVDLPLPESIKRPSWGMIKSKLQKEVDLIINVDSDFYFNDKPDVPYAVVATDPHVLNYDKQRGLSDFFFNMQRAYMKPGDFHLPYACSPDHHYAMSIEKIYDAALIGLHYENRTKLVQALRHKGRNVLYELGLVWDEYRVENNHARVGLNWSSLQDINARTFEIMAMKQIPVMNRLPHLQELGLEENRHYLGFDTIGEAVEKVDWALNSPKEAEAIAIVAHNLVHEKHTYDLRIQQIFDEVKL